MVDNAGQARRYPKWRRKMNGKLLYLAITALLGVLCALSQFYLCLIGMLIYLAFLIKCKQYQKWKVLFVIGIYFIFLFNGYQAKIHNKSVIPESTNVFYFEYIQDVKIDGDLLQILAMEQRFQEKVLVRYKLHSEQEKEMLNSKSFYGLICKATGELQKPSIAKNPNGFNYRKYLETKKIYWITDLNESPLQHCTPSKATPLVLIKQMRSSGLHSLNHFPPEVASLSAALIFGDRNLINPDILSDYQRTGIVHLLAISGLHVSLLVGMVFYLGLRVGFTRQFMTNLLLLLMPIYAVLTGGSPSVIRSVLMIMLVLITGKWKMKFKLYPIDAISLALIFYLMVDPYIIYDIGFQLSFTVSFAIIISSAFLLKRHRSSISKMLITSVISQLAALPLLLYHYFEIPLVSLIANLLYIPLYSFVFMPGLYLLYIINLIFGTAPRFFVDSFNLIINLSNRILSLLAIIPFSHITLGRPNWFMLALYLLLILAIFFIWETGNYSKRKQHLMLLSSFMISFQFCWNLINPYGEVTMIDVGQGDSFFIHLPFGKGNYLIDTGGTVSFGEESWRKRAKPYEVGRDTVVPFLKGKGITTIDKLILTHGDMDHIGGAFSIIEQLKVKEILIPSMTELSETENLILKEAERKGIPVIKVSEGNQWGSGNTSFYILSPVKNYKGERNRGSIAFYAKIGGISWFFGGDLDQEGEEEIIKKYPDLKVQVLKAGHHGSRTSSADDFIAQINPRVALISVGEKNRFGHPHEEVLDKLKRLNTIIYRTDLQGAVTYRFFREKGTFSAYLP
jgi:competence protein ComEC